MCHSDVENLQEKIRGNLIYKLYEIKLVCDMKFSRKCELAVSWNLAGYSGTDVSVDFPDISGQRKCHFWSSESFDLPQRPVCHHLFLLHIPPGMSSSPMECHSSVEDVQSYFKNCIEEFKHARNSRVWYIML